MCTECNEQPATLWFAGFDEPTEPTRCNSLVFRYGCGTPCSDCCDVYECDDADLIAALWEMSGRGTEERTR